MKTLLVIFTATFLAGCDMDKITGIASEPTPQPATPIRVATPKPTPKPGEWMWKQYKNPLERPARN